MASMSSAQIVSASAIHNKAVASGLAGLTPGMNPVRQPYPSTPTVSEQISFYLEGPENFAQKLLSLLYFSVRFET